MRLARAAHDLALALMVGGIAGIFLCVTVLFARAPSRAIAGDIGSAVFGRLGPVVLLLALVVAGARLVLRTGERASWARAIAMAASATVLAVAAFNALWLTPRMIALWSHGERAADGSGLMGEERGRFLMLHGISNVAYLAILLIGLGLIAMEAARRREPR